MTETPERVLWSYPFRPFFLSVAAYAIVLMIGWIGILAGGWPIGGRQPVIWHAHETLIGVVGAAIAGFLLTAIANWTGTRAVHGRLLVGLWLTWLAGRAAFWLGDPSGATAGGLVAAGLDLLFPAALLLIVARILLTSGNRRNYPILGVLGLLLIADIVMLFGPNGGWPGAHFGIDLVVVLMVIIGGRITPAFTRNWLIQRGRDGGQVRQQPRLDQAAMASTAAVALCAPFAPAAWPVAILALLAASVNAWRLTGWATWQTRSDPLLWVLHLGYGWIVIALALRGGGILSDAIPANAWVHAAGVGAMGTLILGVMSRVALGHTGRILALPATGSWMLLAISAAALLRTASAIGWLGLTWALHIAAAFWILAFAWFLVLYSGILVRPRPDGRPG